MNVVKNGEETSDNCSCCNALIYKGLGELQSNNKIIAEYAYRWPQGHKELFSLAIHFYDDNEKPIHGVIAIRGWIENEGINYGVLEPEDSPWGDVGKSGPILTREDSFSLIGKKKVFDIASSIVTNESRINNRITGYA